MLNTNFPPWPSYSKEEAEIVGRVLMSNRVNYWTGEECKLFEEEFAGFLGVKYAIALMNGTVALEAALIALGVGPGDEVIVTPRTFIASISSIVLSGAKPVFADVDRNSQNITAETIRVCITPRSKAIVCVHLAGWPCDMDPIMSLAKEHGLKVIEDCAQSHGAIYKGKPVGGIGDIGCWSFCQDKIMSTGGEGGMITTNNQDLWEKIWSYKDHGKSQAAINSKNTTGFPLVHHYFGTNWRMTEMQAALGRFQLKNLRKQVRIRNSFAKRIWEVASSIPGLRVPIHGCSQCLGECTQGCVHAAYKCYLFVDIERNDRNLIMEKISSMGVPCFFGSCSEVYLEKAFETIDYVRPVSLKNAHDLGETSLMFLCHPTLEPEHIEKTCDVIKRTFEWYFDDYLVTDRPLAR